jgi:hypothetical protein
MRGETGENHYKQMVNWPSFDAGTYLTRSRHCMTSAIPNWSDAPAVIPGPASGRGRGNGTLELPSRLILSPLAAQQFVPLRPSQHV